MRCETPFYRFGTCILMQVAKPSLYDYLYFSTFRDESFFLIEKYFGGDEANYLHLYYRIVFTAIE
jgi:hypothetical protein